jgi:hypothetical protein
MEIVQHLCFWLCLAGFAGCTFNGSTTAPVRGKVTLDGQPVTRGIVHFLPDAGPAASGPLTADGTYRLSTHGTQDGAVIGNHQVYFSPPPTDLSDYSMDDYVANKPPPKNSRYEVPHKYLSPSTSGISAEVKSGKNQIDFDLTSGVR